MIRAEQPYRFPESRCLALAQYTYELAILGARYGMGQRLRTVSGKRIAKRRAASSIGCLTAYAQPKLLRLVGSAEELTLLLKISK
jgi:hypothetical protein